MRAVRALHVQLLFAKSLSLDSGGGPVALPGLGLVVNGEDSTLGVRSVRAVRALQVHLLARLLGCVLAKGAGEALPGLDLGGGHCEVQPEWSSMGTEVVVLRKSFKRLGRWRAVRFFPNLNRRGFYIRRGLNVCRPHFFPTPLWPVDGNLHAS